MTRRRVRTNYYDYQLTPQKVIVNYQNFDVFEREEGFFKLICFQVLKNC